MSADPFVHYYANVDVLLEKLDGELDDYFCTRKVRSHMIRVDTVVRIVYCLDVDFDEGFTAVLKKLNGIDVKKSEWSLYCAREPLLRRKTAFSDFFRKRLSDSIANSVFKAIVLIDGT